MNDEQFAQVIEKIKAGLNDTTTDKDIENLKVSVHRFLKKELKARNKGLGAAAKQTPSAMKPILDLLVAFDNCAIDIDFFSSTNSAEELFPILFKLCFYNDK